MFFEEFAKTFHHVKFFENPSTDGWEIQCWKNGPFSLADFYYNALADFFKNFSRPTLGPKKKLFFLFCSKCLGSKVTAVFVEICQIFFSVFLIFLAPNVKIRKIFFSKIFSSHWDGPPTFNIFCRISYRFCAILQNKTWLVIIGGPSKWSKSPTRPRVFATPRCARRWTKTPYRDIEAAVVYFLSL